MAEEDETLKTSIEKFRQRPDFLETFKGITDGLFRKVLAIVILYFVLQFLFSIGIKSFDGKKWDILLMILTALLNMSGILLGFYYATSQSSQDKDKRIDKAVEMNEEENK